MIAWCSLEGGGNDGGDMLTWLGENRYDDDPLLTKVHMAPVMHFGSSTVCENDFMQWQQDNSVWKSGIANCGNWLSRLY